MNIRQRSRTSLPRRPNRNRRPKKKIERTWHTASVAMATQKNEKEKGGGETRTNSREELPGAAMQQLLEKAFY